MLGGKHKPCAPHLCVVVQVGLSVLVLGGGGRQIPGVMTDFVVNLATSGVNELLQMARHTYEGYFLN